MLPNISLLSLMFLSIYNNRLFILCLYIIKRDKLSKALVFVGETQFYHPILFYSSIKNNILSPNYLRISSFILTSSFTYYVIDLSDCDYIYYWKKRYFFSEIKFRLSITITRKENNFVNFHYRTNKKIKLLLLHLQI